MHQLCRACVFAKRIAARHTQIGQPLVLKQQKQESLTCFIRFYLTVGHTKAWTIPGTEDLKPYIPKKTLIIKWLTVIVGNPIIAAVLAGLMMFIFK